MRWCEGGRGGCGDASRLMGASIAGNRRVVTGSRASSASCTIAEASLYGAAPLTTAPPSGASGRGGSARALAGAKSLCLKGS